MSSGEEDEGDDIIEDQLQSDEENKTTEAASGGDGDTEVKRVKKRTGGNTGKQLSINTCNARSDLALLHELIL